MRKLSLLALAAGAAFLPAAASAQPGPGAPHVVVRHGGQAVHPGMHFEHRRLQRGFIVHPFWFGPQFHVQNWQLYGLAPPPRDHRWIRYHDDAYMIDPRGRVMDERRGLDWDEYGERWEMEDGIPSYYGRGDWHPDEEDYAWAERHRGYGDRGRPPGHDGYGYAGHGYGAAPDGCHPQPGPCGAPAYGGHGQGGYGGYGYYGYGWAYPIIIETTVTTGGCGGCAYRAEEVVQVRERPPRRHHRRPPPPPRYAPPPRHEPPPPPPRAGERG